MKTNAAMTMAAGVPMPRPTRNAVEGPRLSLGTARWQASAPVAFLSVLLAASWCAQAAPAKPTKAAPATNAPAAAVQMEIPQSVFVIPASAREGRNPFFPRSLVAPPIQKPKGAVVDTRAIVLNGITSKPFPSVMINGVTFEKDEEHEIKLPTGGRLKVRCAEIRPDSALIVVNGVEQRELRLRSGL